MEHKTKLIGVILLIALLAAATIGYAFNYYAEHKGGEVDPDYLVITDLETDRVEYDTVRETVGQEYGKPIVTVPVVNGSELVYTVDDSKVSGNYYLTLVSYVIYLDDGTVIYGTVDSDGNNTVLDRSKSTVVTSSDLKLYLDSLSADKRNEIHFTITGSITSDSGLSVSTGTNAPAKAAAIDKVDIRLGVTLYDSEPVVEVALATDFDTVIVGEGESQQIVPTVIIDGVRQYGYAVQWSSADNATATVSDTGLVTGVNASIDPVGISAVFPGAATKQINAYVNSVDVTGDDLIFKDMLRVVIGGTSQALTATPTGIITGSAEWTSNNGYFTVVGDKVVVDPETPDGTSAIITARYTAQDYGSKTYVYNIYVLAYDGSIDVFEKAVTIAKDGTHALTVSKSLYGQSITWESSDVTKATVDSNGVVKAVAEGDATITAKYTVDGNEIKDTVSITVVTPTVTIKDHEGTDVTSGDGKNFALYGTEQLTAVLTGSRGATVQWSSSDTNVIKITDKGLMKAVQAGTAKITASITVDGQTFSAETVDITVKSPTIGHTSNTLTGYKGDSPQFTVTVSGNGGYIGHATDVTQSTTTSDADKVVLDGTPIQNLKFKDVTGSRPVDIVTSITINGSTFETVTKVYVDTPSVDIAQSDVFLTKASGDTYELTVRTVPSEGVTADKLSVEASPAGVVTPAITDVSTITLTVAGIGQAVVTVTFTYGTDHGMGNTYTDTCTVTNKLGIVEDQMIISQNSDDKAIHFNFAPDNVVCSDPLAATISATGTEGTINLLNRAGTYTITASKTVDDVIYTDTCELQVPIAIYSKGSNIQVGQTTSGVAVLLDKRDGEIQWTSSAPGTASVDETGLVTGIATGDATITATTWYQGVEYTASYGIKVVSQGEVVIPTSIISNQESGEHTYYLSYSPANADLDFWEEGSSWMIKEVSAENGKITVVTDSTYDGRTMGVKVKLDGEYTDQKILINPPEFNKTEISMHQNSTDSTIQLVNNMWVQLLVQSGTGAWYEYDNLTGVITIHTEENFTGDVVFYVKEAGADDIRTDQTITVHYLP